MLRIFSRCPRCSALGLVIIVIVAMGMGLSGATVTAAAQEAEVENTTAEPPAYDQRVDSTLVIDSWEYDSGRFSITFQADEPTRVAMTEAGVFEEGTSTFNYAEEELSEGETTVTFAVADRDGAAVAIATEESLERGTGAVVSTGGVAEDPFRHFGGHSGLFSGVAITVALAAAGAGIVVWQEESGVVKA